jgi:hypothetical protein
MVPNPLFAYVASVFLLGLSYTADCSTMPGIAPLFLEEILPYLWIANKSQLTHLSKFVEILSFDRRYKFSGKELYSSSEF